MNQTILSFHLIIFREHLHCCPWSEIAIKSAYSTNYLFVNESAEDKFYTGFMEFYLALCLVQVFVKGIPRALVSEPRKDGQRTMVFFVRFSRISKSFQRTLRSGEFNSGDMKNAHRESAASTFNNPTCLVVFVKFE